MDKEFKTTFIPKRNLDANSRVETKKTQMQRSVLGILALLLFVTALVSVIGVYLYKIRLANVVNSRIESINRAEKAFEPAVVLELKKLDIRLRAGTNLLKGHIGLSDFLESFSESTLPDVSFSEFEFAFDEEEPSVSMTGEARGYLSVAQQSDVFQDNQYIQNHIFSDFSLTSTGNVSFSLQFTLNRDLLTFGRTVKNDQAEDEIIISEGSIISDSNNDLPQGSDINFGSFNQTDELINN